MQSGLQHRPSLLPYSEKNPHLVLTGDVSNSLTHLQFTSSDDNLLQARNTAM